MPRPDEAELRCRARELIDQRALPDAPIPLLWGAHGRGMPCSLCKQAIEQTEIEYDLEARIDGALRRYRFHFLCHAIWQLECVHAQRLKRSE